MKWIYLSPHLDDVALSCGGLVWEQAHAGDQVSIWTICAGDPPSNESTPIIRKMHTLWKIEEEVIGHRRIEDTLSCQCLGADYRHFSIPEAIYRRSPVNGAFLYTSVRKRRGDVHREDIKLVEYLTHTFRQEMSTDDQLVCPLSLGGHVDHRLVRIAAESIGHQIWYYADYPYITRPWIRLRTRFSVLAETLIPISERGLDAWVQSVAAHASQISSYWRDLSSMEVAIRVYCRKVGGIRLWRPK